MIRERQDQGLPPWLPEWGRLTAAIAILVAGLWTVGSLRTYGYGVASPPLEMARWLGEHGKAGERVFTVQWADSSPLLYSAPQLQSLVALDPTAFYLKDPKLFQTYVEITAGRNPDPANAIRRQFGARWATVPYNFYAQVASQLAKSPGVQLVYGDRDYAVMDLGPSRREDGLLAPAQGVLRSQVAQERPRLGVGGEAVEHVLEAGSRQRLGARGARQR